MPRIAEDVQARILSALNSRAPMANPCNFCGGTDYNLLDGYVPLVLLDEPVSSKPADTLAPTVALACVGCGRTEIFNLAFLGLADLIEPAEKVPLSIVQAPPE